MQAAALEGDVHLEVKTDVRAGKRGNTTTLTVNRKLRLPFLFHARSCFLSAFPNPAITGTAVVFAIRPF